MHIPIFFQGLIIGFSVAMPVGPIGILCIRRTLLQGFLSGFITGLGVATADALYGSVAAFGISVISDFLVEKQLWLKIIGGIFLLILGLRILLKNNSINTTTSKLNKTNLFSAYTSALILTLTNPVTILLFASLFSWFNICIEDVACPHALTLTTGIFLGSMLWFTTLSTIVRMLKSKFTVNFLILINKISGILLIIFALITLLSTLIN